MKLQVLAAVAMFGASMALSAKAADPAVPSPVLQVIRLKPGESKRIELALPFGGVDFRPAGKSGRDFMYVETLPKATGGSPTAKGNPIKQDEKKSFELSPGVRLTWVADRPEIDFRAGDAAKAGTTDIKVQYQAFGGGNFFGGYRVIVETK